MSPAAHASTSAPAAPSVREVVQRAEQVQARLGTALENLAGSGVVSEKDCTQLAASLRGLAKVLDRHAPTCHAPVDPAPGSGGRAWVFPGGNR